MVSADSYVLLMWYLPPIIIIIATLSIKGLLMWWESAGGNTLHPNVERKGAFVLMPKNIASFSADQRQLYVPMVVLVLSHLSTLLLFLSTDPILFSSTQTSQALVIVLAMFLMHQTLALFINPWVVQMVQGKQNGQGVPFMLKLLVCSESGLVLISLATVNPSLALLLAIPLLPLITVPTTKSPRFVKLIHWILVLLMSPPVMLAVAYLTIGNSVFELVHQSIVHYSVYGSIAFPLIVLVYWPLNICAQTLLVIA